MIQPYRQIPWSAAAGLSVCSSRALPSVIVTLWSLSSRFVIDASVEVLSRLRGQALVVGTGTLLLTTGLGAWWWAEERWRW